MEPKKYTIKEFADLLFSEDERDIIDGKKVLRQVMQNKLPPLIYDKRGELRLALEYAKDGPGFSVTKYPTQKSEQSRRELN